MVGLPLAFEAVDSKLVGNCHDLAQCRESALEILDHRQSMVDCQNSSIYPGIVDENV